MFNRVLNTSLPPQTFRSCIGLQNYRSFRTALPLFVAFDRFEYLIVIFESLNSLATNMDMDLPLSLPFLKCAAHVGHMKRILGIGERERQAHSNKAKSSQA